MFRKPNLLPSSGERNRQMYLLWRTHQKQMVSVTGSSRCLSWPKYAPKTKSLYCLWTGPGRRYIFWPADLTMMREISSFYGINRETKFPSPLRLRTEALAAHIGSCLLTFKDSLSATFSKFTQTHDP